MKSILIAPARIVPPMAKSWVTDDNIKKACFYAKAGESDKQIAVKLGVTDIDYYNVMYNNTRAIKDQITLARMERHLDLSEALAGQILTIDARNGKKHIDIGLLAIQQRESQFSREALVIARDRYNKKDAININVIAPVPILGNILDKAVKQDVIILDDNALESEKSLDFKGF